MPTAKVFNMAGEQISTIELSEAVFGIRFRIIKAHLVIRQDSIFDRADIFSVFILRQFNI